MPHLTFRHYELRRNLKAKQNLISHEPSRKITQKFQFAVQIEAFQENTLFDLLPLL